MIGLVIAAHGTLPQALMQSAEMIIGDVEQITTVSLMPGDSLEGLIDRIREAIVQVNTGDGALILLDLFGGTPANASAFLSQSMEKVNAVTGVNFPMLAETIIYRMSSDDLQELSDTAVNAGRTGIVNVLESFNQFKKAQ